MKYDVYINIGGTLIDTDDQTKIGFAYNSRWLLNEDAGKYRTFDLSVPATNTNNKVFAFYEEPAAAGVRQSMQAIVMSGGVSLEGKLYVTNRGRERYDLLFVYGSIFRGFRDVPTWGFTDNLTVVDKAAPTTTGRIPNFGWYQYDNGLFNGYDYSPPLSLFPTANLGYIIDRMAALAGYTVNYPDPLLGRMYQADAYGVVLPTMEVYSDEKATVSGHGYGAGAGWTVTMAGGGTLNAAGMDIDAKLLRRGMFNQEQIAVLGFRALRPIRVTFAQGQNVVVVSGNGYDIKNDWLGAGGCDLDMDTGDWFTIVNPADWSMFFGHEKWNGSIYNPHGYESSVSAGFDIHESSGTPSGGASVNLGLNLPEMSLQDYLNAYCLLICATWRVDEAAGTIDIVPFDSLLRNLVFWLNLDGEKIVSIDSAKRYIEGWSQHNRVICKTADGVPEHCRFIRDYPVNNDYLDDEREVGVIPFNEGEFVLNQWGQKAAWIDNVQQQANGEIIYRGVLSLVYENATHDGALHLQTVNDEGLGREYGDFTSQADTFEVSVLMPLYKFLELSDEKAVTFRGSSFVVESAQWGDGVAKLKLLSVNI